MIETHDHQPSPRNDRTGCREEGCEGSALICRECVRALALGSWGGIARHDLGQPRCELCQHASARYCEAHALDAVLEYHAALRRAGVTTGEPPQVDVLAMLVRGAG